MTDALPLLLEPDALEALLGRGDLLIIDLCSAESYARAHVPGAVHLAPQQLQRGTRPAPGLLPDAETLTRLFAGIGLAPDRHVIAYDDEGGGWAGRLIWTLDVLGHPHYSCLNGGLTAWLNEGHPAESGANAPTPSDFRACIDSGPIATAETIVTGLDDPDRAVWDARSAAEYRGDKVLAARGGHIPGAVNLDWLELMDRQRNLRLLEPEALAARLRALGLGPERHIVTHCHSHHRSGLAYLAMKSLGYPRIQGYDGSWGDWGNRTDTPVATGDR